MKRLLTKYGVWKSSEAHPGLDAERPERHATLSVRLIIVPMLRVGMQF